MSGVGLLEDERKAISMSDDMWRPGDEIRRRPGSFESEMDAFDHEEFGGPLFGETSEQPVTSLDEELGRPTTQLSVRPDDTGSLPHWTEPPTGEVPRIDAVDRAREPRPTTSTCGRRSPPITGVEARHRQGPDRRAAGRRPPASSPGTTSTTD